MNCSVCKCPLTVLKKERRTKCSRCEDGFATNWQPPKAPPRKPAVNIRQVAPEKPKDALVLKIDEYLKRGMPKKRTYDA